MAKRATSGTTTGSRGSPASVVAVAGGPSPAARRRGVLAVAAIAALAGCDLATNYADLDGPRYAGDHAGAPPAVGDSLRIVTFNLKHALEVDTGIAALQAPELARPDVLLMQEVDADATERVAAALGLRYVYYPSSVHIYGRDFGPAVLSPHPIVADHKVILPYADPIDGRLRTATAVVLDIGGTPVEVYSVHTSIVTLGLGARLDQLETVIDDAARFAGPVVAGGDFNTGDPGSVDQTGALFAGRGWRWVTAGAGDTADSPIGAVLLDYLFTRGLAGRDAGVFAGEAGSDHHPVWAVVDAP